MSNFATDKISLWIENTESLYNSARALIADDMRSGRVWDAGTALSDFFEGEMDENNTPEFTWSILSDLMGEVDWDRIAESVWGDGMEDEESDDDSGYGPDYSDGDRLTDFYSFTYEEIQAMSETGTYT